MRSYLLSIFIILILAGCGTSSKLTNSLKFPLDDGSKSYNNLAILAFFPVMNNRATLENALEDEFRARGIKANATFQSFPLAGDKQIFDKMGLNPDEIKDLIRKKVNENNIDAFMTINLLDASKEEKYVQGVSVSFNSPYAYSGDYGFYDYYTYAYSTTYSSGHYETSTTYTLQMNMFDIESEQMIWTAQSETIDPQSIKKGSAEFSRIVLDELLRLNILKP
jgi:hypothetical protein